MCKLDYDNLEVIGAPSFLSYATGHGTWLSAMQYCCAARGRTKNSHTRKHHLTKDNLERAKKKKLKQKSTLCLCILANQELT